MSDTNFVPGTVVASSWLNDVNLGIYRANNSLNGTHPNRTLLDKLTDYVSVKDYGAKGDGVTDDTAAIQAAHNSNYHVYYPPGAYSVSGKIQVRVGSFIRGAAAGQTLVLLRSPMAGTEDSVFEVIVTAANFPTQQGGIVVRDLFVNGNSRFGHGFLLRNVRFPIFENVWIFNFNGSAIVHDYVEEGYFNFLNINGCGRTGGSANVSADTLYGSITFDRTAAVYSSSNNNFLRFNDCTLANGNCSGDIMIKGGSPSRIYFTRTQSELSGGSIGNRDWLIARGMGGIFFLTENDVVNYRNFVDQGQFLELSTCRNRVTNSTKFYFGANGTGTVLSTGDSSNGALDVTSISSFKAINSSFGACTFAFPGATTLIGCDITSVVTSNTGASISFRFLGNSISGNLTVGQAPPTTSPYIVRDNFVGGTLSLDGMNVPSASSITLPRDFPFVTISGTTGITSISATGMTGKTVQLNFTGTLTVTDGSNLKLAGNFNATPGSSLVLGCDGTNWWESSRATT